MNTLIQLPIPNSDSIALRCSPISPTGDGGQGRPVYQFQKSQTRPGYCEIDLSQLGLADGEYRFELVTDGATPIPASYFQEIKDFDGESGSFLLEGGKIISRIQLPVANAVSVGMRCALLSDRDKFEPLNWPVYQLEPVPNHAGHFEIDLESLGLADGEYEYELILNDRSDHPIPDPYAQEIVRFGGYRGTFLIEGGRRVSRRFSWEDELNVNRPLRNNNEVVIYEMPMRWMTCAPEDVRQVDIGTFESAIFDHLDNLADLGITAIELLPVQDSPDTLNWGYGTRFFFVPDLDMGSAIDLKCFVKRCHQKGIRVILDIVMNHASKKCPLVDLADDWFFLPNGSKEEGDREDYGGKCFRYVRCAPDGSIPAREFQYRMAEFWIRDYHIDGFRIDEFKGINNWEFIQEFRDRAWRAHAFFFPDRPFLIIAEDSWRRAEITQDSANNPNGRRVVDSMWNFAFRDEVRRLLRNEIYTSWGQPSRTDRVRALLTGRQMWDDYCHTFKGGFSDMAQAVNYVTSHDVEKEIEERLMNYFLSPLLTSLGLDGSVAGIRVLFQKPHFNGRPDADKAHRDALERMRSAFGLMLTSVGIPMFLAGEEFADIHDLDNSDWRLKASDPVDWSRRDEVPGHATLCKQISELIKMRSSIPALQRNEIEFIHFHPTFDEDDGLRVFAFCRTGGKALGESAQIVVIANCGPHDLYYRLPWSWPARGGLKEIAPGPYADAPKVDFQSRELSLSLSPFQVRFFLT